MRARSTRSSRTSCPGACISLVDWVRRAHGGLRRRLRAAQPACIRGDVRLNRRHALVSPPCSSRRARRRARRVRAHALQRLPVGRVASGDAFFYQNPLESDGKHVSAACFLDVACCPANLARLMAQTARSHLRDARRRALYQPLHRQHGKGTIAGQPLVVTQRTRYPWDGAVRSPWTRKDADGVRAECPPSGVGAQRGDAVRTSTDSRAPSLTPRAICRERTTRHARS